MTQNESILQALRSGPLTPLAAFLGHGTMRLAARVHELRAQGHKIATERYEMPSGRNVARYSLVQQ
jgi:hypothetical protein